MNRDMKSALEFVENTTIKQKARNAEDQELNFIPNKLTSKRFLHDSLVSQTFFCF